MASAFWQGATILALAGAVGLVVEHQIGPGLDQTTEVVGPMFPDDETTGSVARPGKRAAAELALSDEQRGRIYEGVMRIADAPVAAAPAPALADALPSGVAMQDLPASLTREIPLVRGHKFVKFDDRIVVVDPASRLVVAMIPRYKLLP